MKRNPRERLDIEIEGIGIVMFSPTFSKIIIKGQDFLATNYTKPQDVLRFIYEGSIVGFGTGSPGRFILNICDGYPTEKELSDFEFRLRLGIKVIDQKVIFRDLYDLIDWDPLPSKEICCHMGNGCYHVTLLSDVPSSGVLGDNQDIWVYFKELEEMPQLKFNGVPMLCE